MRKLRFGSLLLALSALMFVVIAPTTSTIYAQAIPDVDRNAIDNNTVEHVVNIPKLNCSPSQSNVASGSNVYILGDSITVRTAPDYVKAFGAPGIEMTTSISAESGRSWLNQGNLSQGIEGTGGPANTAVDTDADLIKGSEGIVIALGTNRYYSDNPIEAIIEKIRTINAEAPIWWVNIANGGPANPQVVEFNSQLQAASQGRFTIIDWFGTVYPGGENDPNKLFEDGVHPWVGASDSHGNGTEVLAKLVAGAVSGNTGAASTATVSANCQCSATGVDNIAGRDNREKAFNFLLGKGLTPNQAAGIVGNMMRESGPEINPNLPNTQGSGAYGIVQWLGGRLTAMRAWVSAQPPPDNDPTAFNGQIRYMWYEVYEGPEKTGGFDPLGRLQATTTLEEAVLSWEKNFERANDDAAGKKQRLDFATGVLTDFGSNSPDSAGNGGSGCASEVNSTSYDYEDAARGRKLKTTVWTPKGEGPFPVVVFAHGYEQGPDAYERYIKAIAGKGYMVVAPSFPNADKNGILPLDRNASLPEQPADIKFVLDKVLAEPGLQAKMKADSVGIVGHSDGAIDALKVGYSAQKDPRIKAVVSVSSDDISGELDSGPALLQLHGDTDSVASLDGDFANFKKINANPKYFFTVLQGDHFAFVATGGDSTPAVDALTVAFLDSTLNGKPDTLAEVYKQFESKVRLRE